MSSLGRGEKEAFIAISKTRPISVSHAKNPKTIERGLGPIFGFNWNKQLTITVGPKPINDFIRCANGTSLHNAKINVVRHLSKGTFYGEVAPSPLRWELWRAVIATFLLYELTTFQTWTG